MNIFPDTETLILYFSAILEKGRVLSVPKYLAEGLCIDLEWFVCPRG